MKRILLVLLAATLVSTALALRPEPVVAQKRQQVALPDGTLLEPGTRPALTLDGSIGFIAPAKGATVVAFAVRTGELLSTLEGLGNATALSLDESASRRVIALTLPGDELDARPARIAVVDASDPSAMRVLSTFTLPPAVRVAPGTVARVLHGQRIGVISIVAPVPAVLSFDVVSGQQVGALTLDGVPDSVGAIERSSEARLAVVSSETNKVAVLSVSEQGVLLPVSAFSAPADAPLSSTNNAVFSANGEIAYVASLEGRALLSFGVESGELVDRLPTEGSSATISVYHEAERDLLAVVNVSRPGGAPAPDLAPSEEQPLGMPGAVIATAGVDGKLGEQARFYPETGEEIAPTNNADFSADGATVFVPVRTGALYAVDAKTGSARAKEPLDNRVQSIAAAPLAETVAVVTSGTGGGTLDLIPVAPTPVAPETPVADDAPPTDAPEPRRDDVADKQNAPTIGRLAPGTVQSGRRRSLPVTIVGTGFVPGATVIAAGEVYSAEVGTKTRRVHFTLSAALLESPRLVPVQVRNPDGGLSNVVNLEVVSPATPTISKVRPGEIPSGIGGVDLRIAGDHFRDGAVVSATYTDASGQTRSVDLKTYRLGFTQIVARLPQKLTVRAEELSLRVVDRDGAAVSQPASIKVVGPSIATVQPERAVAGDLLRDETLVLRVTGENIHRDAVVFVRRPGRGPNDAGEFRRVPASSVRWRSPERINVRLSAFDLAYSGNLVVRVVNPVPGERLKNGDAVDHVFTVAGPVVTGSSPEVILAGTEAFFLKLDGTDFRRGAAVKIQRADGGGSAEARVTVDDAAFKDRKQINLAMETEALLRLVARPGTLVVRVVNPSVGGGDPSAPREIAIVGPTIAGYEITPSGDDEYRIVLSGTHFRDGATVQVLAGDGTPVGDLREIKFKSSTEVVLRLGRKRVTSLRNFKIVVVNPGGPYNAAGVPSNPIDVAVN